MKIGKVEIDLWSKPGVTGSGPPAVNTERMLEVPLALWFVSQYGPSITEVGAVTPYYAEISHRVFDPYDKWKKCERKSAAEIEYSGLNLLSISTIEHIQRGEYGQPHIPEGAVSILKKMITAQKWLITWAAGYHQHLDSFVEKGNAPSLKFLRKEFSIWQPVESLKGVLYDRPFPYGNAIYVVTNCEELYP